MYVVVFINMKLINFYQDLLLSESKNSGLVHIKPNIVGTNGEIYELWATKHQFKDRAVYGDKLTQSIIDRIDPNENHAVALPNREILKSIQRHTEKVIDSYLSRGAYYNRDKRILFVEGIDSIEFKSTYFLEYVLEYYPFENKFVLITSALSEKGTFLKSLIRKDPKVYLTFTSSLFESNELLETIDFNDIPLVLL